MSGVAIVRYLLAHDVNLLAEVPAARIMPGVLPLKTTLPAISIKSVDATPRRPVDASSTKNLVIERVQVTVLTKDYPKKTTLLNLIRDALPVSRGTVNGFRCDSILPDSDGPDLDDPETPVFERSRDYIVKWHEVAP